MNALQGVQRLRQECGIPGSGPTTIVGQTGELKRLVDWYNQALVEIQLSHDDWRFMRQSMTFNTVADTQEYSLETIGIDSTHATWADDSFRIYLTSAGRGAEVFLTELDYDVYRDTYLYGSLLTTYGQPHTYTITPDESVSLALPPDTIYTVVGDYYRLPVEVTGDTDIPILPARFHMAIVYKAMMKYGAFESAPEVYDAGEEGYNEMYNKLELSQAPSLLVGASLI